MEEKRRQLEVQLVLSNKGKSNRKRKFDNEDSDDGVLHCNKKKQGRGLCVWNDLGVSSRMNDLRIVDGLHSVSSTKTNRAVKNCDI
eukprot:scaffold3486_cov185-Ochromonas_danica.AAC.2